MAEPTNPEFEPDQTQGGPLSDSAADQNTAHEENVPEIVDAETVDPVAPTEPGDSANTVPAKSDAMEALPVDDSVLSEDELQFISEDAGDREATLGPDELTIKNVQLSEPTDSADPTSTEKQQEVTGNAEAHVISEENAKDASAPPLVNQKPPLHWQIKPESQLARESISSVGGALASVVLGCMALIGTFVTSFSAINALLGFALGLWGLNSPRKRMAGIGLGLCVIGFFLPITFGTIQIHQLWSADSDSELSEDPYADTSDFPME